MIGLLFLLVVSVWVVIAFSIAMFAARRTAQNVVWHLPLAVVFSVVLIPLPVADELVGKLQFDNLCKQSEEEQRVSQEARGRTVELRQVPHPAAPGHMTIPRREISGTLIPIREDSWDYLDSQSGKVLLSFKTYTAAGGWLVRVLHISETNHPLTFRSHCEPKSKSTIFQDLNVKKVDRAKQGDAK